MKKLQEKFVKNPKLAFDKKFKKQVEELQKKLEEAEKKCKSCKTTLDAARR